MFDKKKNRVAKPEAEKKPAMTITEMIRQHGKRPLSDEPSSKLDNVHVGSLLQVVELYNMASLCYKEFLSQTELGYKKLKYNSLLRALNDHDHDDTAKAYFLDAIKRFLMIFIYHNKIMPV